MKIILGMMLACFLVTSARAQTAPVTKQAQTDAQTMPENPPTPGQPGQMEKSSQSSGAIIRKHDTPITLDPAKHKKLKKVEKQKKVEEQKDQHSDPHETTESTD